MSQIENKPEVAQRGRMGTARLILSRLWGSLTRNLLLKVFSLLLAVLLWSVLIASDATLAREKVFPSVEVTVVGQETLRARKFIVTDDIAAMIPSVRVRAEVAQGSFDRVTASNFSPRIDLSKVKQAGEQELQVTVPTTTSGQVLEVEPSRIVVNVQEYATIGRIPVVVEVVGQNNPDLWVDTPRADPILVSVSGPKTMVDQVARVVAQLDQTTLSGDRTATRSALRFVPQDAEGKSLDSPLLQVSSYEGVKLDTVLVDVSSYPQREIPVDLSNVTTGEPAEGYELLSVQAEPATIAVAAAQSVLGELTNVFIDAPIQIAGENGTVSASARIKRMPDAKHVSLEEVVITATIAEKRIERTFRNRPIETLGLAEGLTAKLSRTKTGILLTGGYHWLNQLKDENVYVFVDVENLPPGEYELPIQVRVEGSNDYSCELEDAVVTVTISEAKAS